MRGWIGPRAVDWHVVRGADGTWTLDDALVPGLESYVDLDLGFNCGANGDGCGQLIKCGTCTSPQVCGGGGKPGVCGGP